MCVGADDFQFQLMGEQLPKKINLTKEEDHVLSLKIAYAPILDDSNQITKIMLVVEDVTELEKRLSTHSICERSSDDRLIDLPFKG